MLPNIEGLKSDFDASEYEGYDEFKNLSEDQLMIVHSLCRKSFTLVEAPQSTGKTTAVARAVKLLFSNKRLVQEEYYTCIVFGQIDLFKDEFKKFGDNAGLEIKTKSMSALELYGLQYNIKIIDGCYDEMSNSALVPWLVSCSGKLVIIQDSSIEEKNGTLTKVKKFCKILYN